MALPFSDAFEGGATDPLSVAWTTTFGTFAQNGTGRVETSGGMALVTGETFSVDHVVQANLYYTGTGPQPCIIARGDPTGGGRGYFLGMYGGDLVFYSFNTGGSAGSLLGSWTGSGVSGGLAKLKFVGSVWTVYMDGVQLGTDTSGTYSDGVPGIIGYNATAWDNFYADNAAGGGGSTSAPMLMTLGVG